MPNMMTRGKKKFSHFKVLLINTRMHAYTRTETQTHAYFWLVSMLHNHLNYLIKSFLDVLKITFGYRNSLSGVHIYTIQFVKF